MLKISALGLLALTMAVSSASSAAWNARSGNTGLSVFAAYDKVSEQTGIGLSLSSRNQGISDVSAVAFGDSIVLQSSQLRPLGMGVLPIYAGMTAAYAFERGSDGLTEVPSGFMSGVEVVFAKTQPSAGLSIDLRASSLSKGLNPIKWISDPDMLWVGAGMSYSF